MLIELIMFSAVVMVGTLLLVSDSIKRVYPIATSMKVMVRAHLTTPLVLRGVKATGSHRGRCAIDRSAILDFRNSSHIHRNDQSANLRESFENTLRSDAEASACT